MRVLSSFIVFIAVAPILASAQPSIGIETQALYIHADGSLAAQLDPSSGNYFSTLDAENRGTFGWKFTNTTGSTLSNVSFLGFLDADLDSNINTFFNEYGVFIGLSSPPTAPGGSIAASSWQIDEPGFVFGTIIDDLIAGTLLNQNFVPSSAPDDVSLALGFSVGSLTPGQTATLTMEISMPDIGGLEQVDPDSGSLFYLNGWTTVNDAPVGLVPDPSSVVLLGSCVALCLIVRIRNTTRVQS